MAPRFEHSTLVVCAKQREHSPIAALNLRQYIEELDDLLLNEIQTLMNRDA
jgi:hypothetical protein